VSTPSISLASARRLALAAQGLAAPRREIVADRRHLRAVLRHTGLFQIDSVNVLARAHYLPAFSRIGPYPQRLLDGMAFRHRELFEYWGHEAALLPVALHPLMRWRMARGERLVDRWGRIGRLVRERPGYVDWVHDEVVARGPVTAGEVAEDEKRGTEEWGWNWTDAKTALEYLFYAGRVAISNRRNFERHYDLPERVLPASVLAVPTPTEEAAHRELLLLAARFHGVGTAADLADYFRIGTVAARPRLAELVEDGRIEQVEVRGWQHPAFMLAGAKLPRRAAGRALLVPFDPLVWERSRAERLFGFRYRLEIYTPAHKRVHGYYVLPFLLRDALVARVDLKADRAIGTLRVRAAWGEPGAPDDTVPALADELALLASWLELDAVVVEDRGDLASALSLAVAPKRG
jgi:uncharacterized protein